MPTTHEQMMNERSKMNVKVLCLYPRLVLRAVVFAGLVCLWHSSVWAEDFAGRFDFKAGVITDAAGRKIKIAKAFKRIISLYGAHTENLYSLNAEDQLIGVGRNESWPPRVAAKPVFSYHDDLEKFLAARPDLVLIRPMIDRGYGRLMAQLEKHGITVVSLQPASIEEMFVYWRALGALTGHRKAAENMVRRFTRSVEQFRRLTAGMPQKKRVYFESIHSRMRTFAPDAMPIFVLKTAGGVNVAVDAPSRRGTNIADYGKERILSRGEDIDVYFAQVGPMNRPTVETIQSEPGYHLIKAVRENRIYLIDETLVSRPTLRMLTGMCRIGKILYPDLFENETQIDACREDVHSADMKSK